jgi:hypothetical protein
MKLGEISGEFNGFFRGAEPITAANCKLFAQNCVDKAIGQERERTIEILLKHLQNSAYDWDTAVKSAVEEINEP